MMGSIFFLSCHIRITYEEELSLHCMKSKGSVGQVLSEAKYRWNGPPATPTSPWRISAARTEASPDCGPFPPTSAPKL